MDGTGAPGDHSSSSDFLLLPLPPESSLTQGNQAALVSPGVEDLPAPVSQGADDDDNDGEDSDGSIAQVAVQWSSEDPKLLKNSQEDDIVPNSCLRSLDIQMDSEYSNTRWESDFEKTVQEEGLIYDKMDGSDLQWADRFTPRFFSSITLGDLEAVGEHLKEIHQRGVELTAAVLRERPTGKTCLMKALLRSQDKSEQQVRDMVSLLLQHAEEHGELASVLNASYTDRVYQGQTALHIAIARGLKDIVRLLVEKGANLRARATGSFFQLLPNRKHCFYFGEYPLSLAACTLQSDLVMFLLDQPDPCLAEARDSLQNTVLHALVLQASDHPGVVEMYELVLKLSEKKRLKNNLASKTHLEKLRNKQGLTPLQLAAKEGQLQLFQHILSRELPMSDPLHHLSRRFIDWAYGPISCSLYDLSEVDTTEANSAVKMVVSSPSMEKASELLEVEPLRSLLEAKWTSFGAALFAISTTWYLLYIGLFTAITVQQPGIEGSQESAGLFQNASSWRNTGQVYIFLSASGMLLKTGLDIVWMWPFQFLPFLLKSYFHVLCFLQAGLVLCSLGLSWIQAENLEVVQGVALVLGWFDLLYYSRAFKLTGIFTVVLQKMILIDVFRFLLVYVVFLLGFASALSALTDPCPESGHCLYYSLGSALGALFKLTFGLGDLSVPKHSRFPVSFLLLLITYVILTSVLLLNMLIALMNETVNMASSQNQKIWRVQRAITILDLERCLPVTWRYWLQKGKICSNLEVGLTEGQGKDLRSCLRVNEERRQERSAEGNQVMGINEDPTVFLGQTCSPDWLA